MTHLEKLQQLAACEEGQQYAANFSDPQEAWNSCDRGDWMLWLVGALSGQPESEERKKLVMTACECVRLAVLPIQNREHENVILKCLETTEKWSKNAATIDEVKQARTNAYAANAYAADAYAAAYAAYAAYAYTAPANAAANVAYYAAYAAYAATVSNAAYATAKILKECADIVRKHYPVVPDYNVGED